MNRGLKGSFNGKFRIFVLSWTLNKREYWMAHCCLMSNAMGIVRKGSLYHVEASCAPD
jgi:hypothetical protein